MSNNLPFGNSYFSQKVILYLIPPLLGLFIFLNQDILGLLFDDTRNITETKVLTNDNKALDNNAENMTIVQSYEKLSNLLDVKIISLKFTKEKMLIQLGGNIASVFDFLSVIETSGHIISLDLKNENNNESKNENNKILADCVIVGSVLDEKIFSSLKRNKNINQKITQQELNPTSTSNAPKTQSKSKHIKSINTQNETVHTTDKASEELVDESYIEILPKSKTLAIVGEYVLIGGEWLKVGDVFDGYKIIEITKKNLKLQKNGHEIIQEMFDD